MAVPVVASDAVENTPTRVLVVEDDLTMSRSFARWLRAAGYEVETASGADEALAVIQSDCPLVVIVDLDIAGLDGAEFCRQTRARDSAGNVYLLCLTEHLHTEQMLSALEAGANDFLSRPLNRARVLMRMRFAEFASERLHRYAAMADTDALTGSWNRRRFEHEGDRLFQLAVRHGRPLACVLIDIDLFKHINDTHGHASGDKALSALADLIQHESRETDVFCRYGGDEFCVLLAESNERGAEIWAERLRTQLADQVLTNDGSPIPLRVTLGAAQLRPTVRSLSDLIANADEALRTAKQTGRDRVLCYSSISDADPFSGQTERTLRNELTGVTARQVMTSPVISLREDQPLRHAADLFLRLRINSAPVVDGEGLLVGIISEKDLLNATLGRPEWDRPLGEVMRSSVICYQADTPMLKIWEYLRRVTIRRVVILDGQTPIGVISRGSLLRWVGNWGLARSMDRIPKEQDGEVISQQRLAETTSAMAMEFERFQRDYATTTDPVPCMVNTASRLQQYAQDILAYSQIFCRFEPETTTAEIVN